LIAVGPIVVAVAVAQAIVAAGAVIVAGGSGITINTVGIVVVVQSTSIAVTSIASIANTRSGIRTHTVTGTSVVGVAVDALGVIEVLVGAHVTVVTRNVLSTTA